MTEQWNNGCAVQWAMTSQWAGHNRGVTIATFYVASNSGNHGNVLRREASNSGNYGNLVRHIVESNTMDPPVRIYDVTEVTMATFYVAKRQTVVTMVTGYVKQ